MNPGGVNPSWRVRATMARLFSRDRRRAERDGYVLVLVAVMMFVLMALATLIIDFGFVRLTQRQMLAATDAAALEGLRWRDVQQWEQLPSYLNPSNLTGPIDDPSQKTQDTIRRLAAAHIVSLMMPSVNSTDPDPATYGAGPELQLTPTTAGGGLAGPLVAPGQPPVYQPQLQTNSGNATEGDVVSGMYGPDAPGVEQFDYTRKEDFSPPLSGSAPTAPSFLVRMRRVAPGNSLDSEPGVSSSGPAVPYLFGYGVAADRSIISQGVTVRGTSIASVGFQPPSSWSSDPYYASNFYQNIGAASSVGWPYSWKDSAGVVHQLTGAVPVAITSDQWTLWFPSGQTATSGVPVTLEVASDYSLTVPGQTAPAGFVADPSAWAQNTVPTLGLTAAQLAMGSSEATTIIAALPTNASPASQSSVYVLIINSTNEMVVGFGAADNFVYSPSANGKPATIAFTAMPNRVAWANASASLVQPLPSGAAAGELWSAHAAVPCPLYSPVLVNRLGPAPN